MHTSVERKPDKRGSARGAPGQFDRRTLGCAAPGNAWRQGPTSRPGE
ncbi:hypothetical protein [Streptomyces sp. NPDC058625]